MSSWPSSSRPRRSARVLALLVLTSLMLSTLPVAATRAAPPVPAPDAPVTRAAAPQRPTPPPAPSPVLGFTLEFSAPTIAAGSRVSATLILKNTSKLAATGVVVRVPAPAAASLAASTAGAIADGALVWELGTVPPSATHQTVIMLDNVRATPAGTVLLQTSVRAQETGTATTHTHGVLVDAANPATATNATGRAGLSNRLQSPDGRVVVELPTTTPDVHLEYLPLAAQRQRTPDAPLPSDVAGFKRGLGVFAIQATDAKRQPATLGNGATLAIAYTPEQLQARGISEADLTVFQYVEKQRTWVPLATSVDPTTRIARTALSTSGQFQLGDGSSPSEAYLPSVQGWQVSTFTGAASFSFPIDVPAGPAGMKPNLALNYSSAAGDGKHGLRGKQQAGWAGRGWSLDMPSISMNKINGLAAEQYYSLSLNGMGFDLVRGAALPALPGDPATPSPKDPSKWEWKATDESFVKVRVVQNGVSNVTERGGQDHNGTPIKRYTWYVWSKDGTRHEFSEDVWWGFCPPGDIAYLETARWLLKQTKDVYGNTMTYNYDRKTQVYTSPACYGYHTKGVIDLDIWPTSITWGNVRTTTPATDRYQITFESQDRGVTDADFDVSGTQYGSNNGAPRQSRRLDAIKVYAKPGAAFELVRQYNFGYDASLLSDAAIQQADGTYRPDFSTEKLTLKSITRVGNDGIGLQPTTFEYAVSTNTNIPGAIDPVRGTTVFPNGNWNRLTKVNNGQGGAVAFTYENIGAAFDADGNGKFVNNRRVTKKTLTDGRGNSYDWTYAYTNPAVNTMGDQLDSGDGTQVYPNSAVLYYNRFIDLNGAEAYRTPILAHAKFSEFRGHSSVTETNHHGPQTQQNPVTQTQHWFYQGQADNLCVPTATNSHAAIDADPCFQAIRTNEILRGREYRTVSRGSAGSATLAETQETFAVEFLGYSNQPLSGLWRAFSYGSKTVQIFADSAPATGDTLKQRRTDYFYDKQGGIQYGNLTRVEEYDETGTLYRKTVNQYETLDTDAAYIVDRKRAELIYNGTGVCLAQTVYQYDGRTTQYGLVDKGTLTLVRKYSDVALLAANNGSTLNSVDTSLGYDPIYGNQTSVTTYAAPGTKVYNGSTVLSAPGNGSAATTTTTEYDAVFHAYPTKITQPLGLIEQAEYDYRMGTMTLVRDFNTVATTAEYDTFGRMIKLIKPGDTSAYPTVQAIYDDFALPFRYEVRQREISGQPGVRIAQQFYDGLGRKIQTKSETQTNAENVVAHTIYNSMGQVIQQSVPVKVAETSASFTAYTPGLTATVKWTNTTYDPLGRPLDMTGPDGTKTYTRYWWSTYGAAVTTTDANGHKTRRESDVFGRLRKVIEFSGNDGTEGMTTPYATTTYAYSPLDLLTTVTDAQNNVTQMGYDSLGRKLSMSDPDMGAWSYTYDIDSNLKTQTDAKNQTLTFTYDDLNRLTSKAVPNSGTITYGYDLVDATHAYGKGRQTGMTDLSGTRHFSYTARGEVAQERQTVNSTTYTTNRTYRADGKLVTLTYPTGEVLTHVYNDAGQLTTLSSGLATYQSQTTYDALGQILERSLGGNAEESSTYDPLTNRLTSKQVELPPALGFIFGRQYTYDAGGNVKTVLNNATNETLRYTYDHRDRLTSACTWNVATSVCGAGSGAFNQTYTYNTIGNLTTKAGVTQTYDNGKPHQLSSTTVGGATAHYTYDANGNMLTGVGRVFTWNVENQPTQISTATTTETYMYDGNNTRIKKSSVTGGTTTTTIYIGGIVEYRGNQVISNYGVASRTTTGNPSGSNLGTLLFHHSDHLGSVSTTSDAAGNVIDTQEFTPWGEVRNGGITSTELNYTGQHKDAGTGLLFYNARYYDAAIGRFTSADSIVPGTSHRALTVDYHENLLLSSLRAHLAGSNEPDSAVSTPQLLNRYSYVSNNPLRYSDPTGHEMYFTNVDQAQQGLDKINEAMEEMEALEGDVEANVDAISALVGGLVGDLIGITGGGAGGGVIGGLTTEALKQIIGDFGVGDVKKFLRFMAKELQAFINAHARGGACASAQSDCSLAFYFRVDGQNEGFIVADHWKGRNSKNGHRYRHKQRQLTFATIGAFEGSISVVDTKGWWKYHKDLEKYNDCLGGWARCRQPRKPSS